MKFFREILKSDKQLFSDLKPGERILQIVKRSIFPDLEKMGFKLFKAPLAIKRQVGEFEQEIYFQKNLHNYDNQVVAFLPHFNVTSKVYVQWCKKKYGIAPLNEYIMGASATYVPNWSKKYFDNGWYDLAKDNNTEIVKVLNDNIHNRGIAYLNTFSEKQSTINYILKQNNYYYKAPMLFDFAFLLNDKNEAVRVIKWFDDYRKRRLEKLQDDTLRNMAIRQELLRAWK